MLVEIVEESIRIYWRFIRADKNCSTAILKSRKGQTELQDPADSQTFREVQKDFKKVRSYNMIIILLTVLVNFISNIICNFKMFNL